MRGDGPDLPPVQAVSLLPSGTAGTPIFGIAAVGLLVPDGVDAVSRVVAKALRKAFHRFPAFSIGFSGIPRAGSPECERRCRPPRSLTTKRAMALWVPSRSGR